MFFYKIISLKKMGTSIFFFVPNWKRWDKNILLGVHNNILSDTKCFWCCFHTFIGSFLIILLTWPNLQSYILKKLRDGSSRSFSGPFLTLQVFKLNSEVSVPFCFFGRHGSNFRWNWLKFYMKLAKNDAKIAYFINRDWP